MEILRKIWGYVIFKKNTDPEKNLNLKVMHGINKLSILMFLVGMIVLIYKCSR
jgi:hypothetical protein